jgi:hypothetical protein
MKKLLMVMQLLLLCCTMAFASPTTGLSVLKGQHRILWKVDWSQLKIEGMNRTDWLKYRQAEQPEYDATYELEYQLKPRIVDMVTGANSKLTGKQMVLCTDSDCTYTLVLQPVSLSKKGNCTVKCYVKQTKSGRTVYEFFVLGRGGVFGSMSNLWGDGFQNAGKRLGKMIISGVKE